MPHRDPTKHAEYQRRWKAKNPEKALRIRRKSDLKRYGMTEAQYGQICEAQGNQCLICGKHKGETPRARLFVDHDHMTGKVRGLLCLNCNSGIGLMNDDPRQLRCAAEYLESQR